MLETHEHEINTSQILEKKVFLIDELFRETCLKIARFLKKMGFSFKSLLSFIRNPSGLHRGATISIAKKVLNDVIGAHYFHIKKEQLLLKLVYHNILNKLFRGTNQYV